jgi:hypothetical protein
MDEDDILDDREVVMNQRLKKADSISKPDIDGTYAKFMTTENMYKEIEKMSKKLEED